uniref:Uncharacterized protein n=1 Tax=Rhizophora mucronata TaxID=61149 RepID=A0A2P2QJ40_RHIMU
MISIVNRNYELNYRKCIIKNPDSIMIFFVTLYKSRVILPTHVTFP